MGRDIFFTFPVKSMLVEVFRDKFAACFLPTKVRGCVVWRWETAEVGRFGEWDWARHCEGRAFVVGQKRSDSIAKSGKEVRPQELSLIIS